MEKVYLYSGLKRWLKDRGIRRPFRIDYQADGMALTGKNLAALDDPRFVQAYAEAARLNAEGWPHGVPDISFRAHVCCWAATQALKIEGDFVECGVHTGLLSLTVAHYMNFASLGRTFWLFDTFSGIPTERLSGVESAHAKELNETLYFDCYELARRNFRPVTNARLVRGVLPETVGETTLRRIAYLSMDLNNAEAEMATIDVMWPMLSPGAIVVLDDYAFATYERQHEAWDEFARSHGVMVLTLPTGQGLLIKPAA